MEVAISKTKIVVPPRRAELLSRPRLLESMNALLDRKLILLSAPAGYGKTSLLIDLAHSTRLPICWLALDQLDRDPQRFMAYLIAALAEQFQQLEAPLRAQLDQLKSINTDAEPLLVTLTNELYDQVEQDFVLIIDDYHLLEDVPIISSLMTRFLQLVEENCHVLISSRTLVALPDLPLMVAREQVDGLNQTELVFLPGEIQALFAQNRHQHLSDEKARQLVEQTGGWITGVMLSDLSGLTHVAGVDTFSYLSQQVIAQLPEVLRTFLLRTSLPEEFNAALCQATLAEFYITEQNWSALMESLLKKNLFVQPIGIAGGWLRYHPLFREFLQTRLAEERPQEVGLILERLTSAYEKAGEWEKAYYTCQQLYDPKALASLVERAGTPMVQHALITLDNWINSLPPSIVRGRPSLISLRGVLATGKGNLHEGLSLFNEAEAAYRKKEDVPGLALTLIRRATGHRFLGNYTVSSQDCEQALTLTEERDDLQNLFAEALRVKGLNLYTLGRSRQAIECLERSLALYTALNQTASIPILLMETGMAQMAIGELQACHTSYLKALEIWRAENNLLWQANLLNNLGVLYHQMGEYERAAEAYDNGLSCAVKSRNRRTEALILAGLGDLYAEVEEYETALQAYQKADAITSEIGESFTQNYLILAQALLASRRGEPAQGSRILEDNKYVLQISRSSYERSLRYLIQGRIRLLEGLSEEAVSILRECKASFIEDGRDLESMWSRVWLAAAFYSAGHIEPARAEFREILSRQGQNSHALLVALGQAGSWLGNLRADAEIGRNLNSLMERADKLKAKLPAIRRSLRHMAQPIQIPSAGLSIQAFGHAEVKVNGKSLNMADWHTQSVRDLFFYFLFNPRPLTREQVKEALWPEIEDPRIIYSRFRNEMYRLRRAVGKDVIIFDDEYYHFNHSLDYEYDIEAFEASIARARTAHTEDERIQHYQKAAQLVSGPYLAGADYDWAIEERNRLNRAHLAVLEELARLHLNQNNLAEAISISQVALQVEPYNENLYRLAMRAHAACGDRPAVVRLFQAGEEAVRKLGFSLSEETCSLYHELTGLATASSRQAALRPEYPPVRRKPKGKSIRSPHSSR
jgi:LuxR family maltose regulon positive regulatory protein